MGYAASSAQIIPNPGRVITVLLIFMQIRLEPCLNMLETFLFKIAKHIFFEEVCDGGVKQRKGFKRRHVGL